MIDLAQVLLRSISAGLVSERAKEGGIKKWIQTGTYGVALEGVGGIVLNGIAAADFYPFLLFDYERFAMASRESAVLSFKKPFNKRATAWALINRYYSSFFSAHALLRAHNRGVTWLDADEANHLTDVGRLYLGQDFAVKKGGYAFVFDGADYNATVKLAQISFGGGSHDEFWLYFSDYLRGFANDLLRTNAPAAALVSGRVAEIEKLVKIAGYRGSWLAHMRNEINYQHKFGTWFPFKFASDADIHRANFLSQKNEIAMIGVDPKRLPIAAFNSMVCFLASVNNDFAELLKERAGDGARKFKADWNRLNASMAAV